MSTKHSTAQFLKYIMGFFSLLGLFLLGQWREDMKAGGKHTVNGLRADLNTDLCISLAA